MISSVQPVSSSMIAVSMTFADRCGSVSAMYLPDTTLTGASVACAGVLCNGTIEPCIMHSIIATVWWNRFMLTAEDIGAIQQRIIELQIEHRDLDEVIDKLSRTTDYDQLQMRRLKKRKLQLKDTITLLEMRLIPDIPA